ncbi:MAG TPA: Ig-like domain-containing protein [Thermoanaerobaculia bacterium]|nr:Ig-like domain-containing protein [Thermoanaerobaculia bacterium]
MRAVRLVPLLALPLLFSAALAADLPRWNDDSSVTLTPYPRSFAPAVESTNLVAQVFHDLDMPAQVNWLVTVTDAQGNAVRRFSARQRFQPGEAILFAPTWNGRDEGGRFLPNGMYTATVEVEIQAAGERVRPIGEDDQPRVAMIRQATSHPVIIDSVRRGRVPVTQSQTPHDPGVPYNFYYGTLHNQTSYTDGGHPNDSACASSTIHGPSDFDPVAAYNYARNTARLDFMGIADHNHLFNDACSGCSATQVVQRYHDGLTAAANATVNGIFVGIYGMEWGYISNPDAGFPNEGHVGVFESPKLFGWEPSSTCAPGTCYYDVYTASGSAGYTAMYTTALLNPSPWGAFGQFMHPSDGTKSAAGQGVDFNSIQYTTDGDDFIHTAAVISGPAAGFSTTATDTGALYAGEPVNGSQYAAYTSIDMFNRILGAGYHVAPAADPDVHCSNYGTSTRDRTVILASSLTKAALFDAIHQRRVYATSDSNVQLVYNMNANATTYWMGSGGIRTAGRVATSGSITLHISVWDPDAGESATSIKIKEPVPGNTNGAETVIATATSSPFDYTFTPSNGNHTYYAYVTMNTGDRIWSAPIWINQGGTPDTTPPTTSITAPASGAIVSGTTTVTASASDNVGVTRVEFYLDNVLQSTSTASPYQWSWNTTTSANGSHNLNSKAYDAAGNIGTSTTVTVTVSNVADTTPPTTSITAPANGATVSGTTTVTASASDNVGVTRVEFYLDNVLQSTSTASPYQWSWNTTASANGSHNLSSKAYDAAGNIGTSTTVTVTVSNVADTTAPTAPANLVASTPTSNGNGSRRKINLSWTASTDNVGVSGYQIWRATSSSGPFSQIATSATTSYTNTGLTSGTTYWYYVQAYDAAGNVSAASNTASATAK